MKLSGLLCLRSMMVCNRDPGQGQIHYAAVYSAFRCHSPSIVARRSIHTIDTTLYVIRGPLGRSRGWSSVGMSFCAGIHDGGGGGSATVVSTVDCDLADSSIEQ
jgi:hypothetical protein